MNRRRSTLAAAVVVSAALALTACGGGEPQAADMKSISIMAPFLEAQPPSSDGAVQKKLEEMTGKDITISWAPNASYEDKMNITLASSDIPQVLVVQSKSPGFVKNAEAGAFWDLTDKLKDYPNLKTTFPEVQQNASVNGKVYGVFRARNPIRAAVMFRQDWLDKVGMKLLKRWKTFTKLPRPSPNRIRMATARMTPTESPSPNGDRWAPTAPTT